MLNCRGLKLPLGPRTLLMGILNVTPDSFYDGGRFVDVSQALTHARAMVAAGASIIDLGGESTRPNAHPIDTEEELRRILPVLKSLLRQIDIPISVDTYKPAVAQEALALGAHMINDIHGLRQHPDMASTIARNHSAVIITHNCRNASPTDNIVTQVIASLRESLTIAKDAGIANEAIVLDPGIGFGKTVEQNLTLVARLSEITALGFPVLLGASRKSFISHSLNLPNEECLEGTLATTALAVEQGVHILRIHDIIANRRTALLTEAILRFRT